LQYLLHFHFGIDYHVLYPVLVHQGQQRDLLELELMDQMIYFHFDADWFRHHLPAEHPKQ
jgi:hypothetical protein